MVQWYCIFEGLVEMCLITKMMGVGCEVVAWFYKFLKSVRNSYNPARWFKQIKRTVSFDVTRFNPTQQSTYSTVVNDQRNSTISSQLSTKAF